MQNDDSRPRSQFTDISFCRLFIFELTNLITAFVLSVVFIVLSTLENCNQLRFVLLKLKLLYD